MCGGTPKDPRWSASQGWLEADSTLWVAIVTEADNRQGSETIIQEANSAP